MSEALAQENKKLPTVLFVDDDWKMLEAIKERFSHFGYEVLTASRGEDSLALARKVPIDIAVLDISMPEMDGYELINALRLILPTLPIVFLTGKSDKNTALKTFQFGSNCLVEKPCTPRELDARLKRIIEGSQAKKIA